MPSPYDIVEGNISGKFRDTATWAYYDSHISTPVNGSISGTVTENGVALPYCTVLIYFRASGALISRTRTDSAGAFTFSALDPTAVASPDDGRYFVVALDPAGGVRYNAIIVDRMLAV